MDTPDFTGARWIKSRRSNEGGSACVELAKADGWVGIRDSKEGDASPILPFQPEAFSAFMSEISGRKTD